MHRRTKQVAGVCPPKGVFGLVAQLLPQDSEIASTRFVWPHGEFALGSMLVPVLSDDGGEQIPSYRDQRGRQNYWLPEPQPP